MNYRSQLENMCRPGERVAVLTLLDKIQVRGVTVDISFRTINRFFHGPNFTPQATAPSFYAQIKNREKQRSLLANIVADGELAWMTNPNERICKSSWTQAAKFW